MWYVVDSFAAKGWPPPQFHGKWPFVRWLGLQEPASVIFSLMNLAVHLVMLHQFRSRVRPGGPMYKLWYFYFVVCANAWIWSAIFHSRDLPFTECMDYLSAFCMVFYSLYGMLMRMLIGAPFMISLLLTLVFLSFLLNHAAYLILDQLDYHYNMTANIVIGFISAACSAMWCILNWKRHSHSRNLAVCLTWGILTTLLEISDFPPIAWTFDAHALWHLSTTPVPYFFWSFVIEDCKYLRKTYMKER
ncbi:post-GPI attachment to proteins factor 3 [Nilaparvata lugens]|uniref:post-GPI attachment to proteins factor 3 n=1 Tax=Nilaparvata lugens TaxID=108931 RepID=UPI00193C9457|nr:post-GPI attachment to proteins factor 3 [Nilaparvata lugens]